MSLASWILDRITPRRAKRLGTRPSQEVHLYLRRMEDRRVLSVTAVADAYFVEEFSSAFFAPPQLGVVSNDFDMQSGPPLQAVSGTFSTDLGGTVTLDQNGAFDYIPPTGPGSIFIDHFTYIATNGSEFSNVGDVTLFVGEVPVPYEQPVLLPIFGVESETPFDTVEVTLFSSAGASLTILNPSFITFTFGNNGESNISFVGTAQDVNKALDTLEYKPPSGFGGYDDLLFEYIDGFSQMQQLPPQSIFVPVFVEPPGGFSFGSVFAVPDEYYVDSGSSAFFTAEAGVLSNDFSSQGNSLFAISDFITTDLGGTVSLSFDGSFDYTPPNLPNGNFVDSFAYFVSDEGTTEQGFVTLYVGEVPVLEDQPVLLPLFTVEGGFSDNFSQVQLTSIQGGSLTLFNTLGIIFDASSSNGDSSITFSGLVQDVNFALDSLEYAPPLDFSGNDLIIFDYELFPSRGQLPQFSQFVPIDVIPVADAPHLEVAPNPVKYLPQIPADLNIDVFLVDVDGSEIPGLVILQHVPMGVIPSVGQQSPIDPTTYFVLPGDLENLFFFIDFAAPESFSIAVIATTIETTNQPGVFGGPGGPLLPNDPFDLRFAFSVELVDFVRLPMPEVPPPPPLNPPPPPPGAPLPPPPMPAVFLIGPLLAPPPPAPKLTIGPEPSGAPDAPPIIASVIEFHDSSGNTNSSSSPLAASHGPQALGSNSVVNQEQNDDEGRRSSETSGIYVCKLGGDGPGQIARLPEDLSEDYSRFMAFLKTLPNGDYVVYFKRGGQSHEQASLRQVVVKVRVVNHRLNPDPGEFKPAGEVAEPPLDPNAPNIPATTRAADAGERVELAPPSEDRITREVRTEQAAAISPHWTPLMAGAGMAVIAGWKLKAHLADHSGNADRLMERYSRNVSRRFRGRKGSGTIFRQSIPTMTRPQQENGA